VRRRTGLADLGNPGALDSVLAIDDRRVDDAVNVERGWNVSDIIVAHANDGVGDVGDRSPGYKRGCFAVVERIRPGHVGWNARKPKAVGSVATKEVPRRRAFETDPAQFRVYVVTRHQHNRSKGVDRADARQDPSSGGPA